MADERKKEITDEENRRARRIVFIWSGLTLLYLWGDLKFRSGGQSITPFGLSFEGVTETKFLVGLLVINLVFWVKLLWLDIVESLISNKVEHLRVILSEDWEEPLSQHEKYGGLDERTVDKHEYYQNLHKLFNRLTSQWFPVGISLFMGLVAIALLI